MEPVAYSSRQRLEIPRDIWDYFRQVECGRYHQNLVTYIEGLFVSFTLYKGTDAALWLNRYINAFKPNLVGVGHLRYKPNEAYPIGGLKFAAYQRFMLEIIQDGKARDLLIDFLEREPPIYQDSITLFLEQLMALEGWRTLNWITNYD